MTIIPAIYDWRSSLVPLHQIYRAGGQERDGGMTLSGAMISNPEPGGRGMLRMIFRPFSLSRAVNADVSWTISRLLNQSVMRVRLRESMQLVCSADLNVTDTGQTWANGQPWANDENWRSNPFALVAAIALAGSETFTVDLSVTGQVLSIGHVIGFFLEGYDFAHIVMDIDYDGANLATVTVSPPLRRSLAANDLMLFRPSMLVTCMNARELSGDGPIMGLVSLPPVSFAEFLA